MKLTKIKIPYGHMLSLTIKRKELDELVLTTNGDLVVNFQQIGDKFIPNIVEDKTSSNIFGFAESISDDEIDDGPIEPPII